MKGLKGIIGCAVAMISACALMFSITACNEKAPENKHTHSADKYFFDEDKHWKECDDCGATFSLANHDFQDGVCQTCGYYNDYTEGLEFTEVKDDNDVVVAYCVSGIGTATGTVLKIPYFHNSLPVTQIGGSAFDGCTEIESLTIPDSVTDAGQLVFQDCTGLVTAEIGNGLQSMGFAFFNNCTSLTDVHIGNGVLSIGDWAFRNCTSLTTVYLPDSLIELNGGAFEGCNLEYNEYENAKYLGSETNPYMALITVINKKADTITIPDGTKFLNGESFSNCSNITEIVVPEGVLSFARSTFQNCTKLESVTLPSTLRSIGNTSFSNCRALTSIVIGENVKSIGQNAFQNCTKLTGAVFENPEGWYYKAMLNLETTTDITDDLTDEAVAATCLKTKYTSYFWLHD